MLSLTEDGRPGGTFRTFFGWISEREGEKKNVKQYVRVYQAGFYLPFWKGGPCWICLNIIDQPGRKERGRLTFPTAVDLFTKEAFTANKRDTMQMQKIKRQDTKSTGPGVFFFLFSFSPFFLFGLIKGSKAAFDMFILFFRVSLKGSERAVY